MSAAEEQETRSQPTPGPSQPQPLPHLATEEKDDTWTTREKLVLALCVVTRGDQNWTGFRQTIKHYAEKDRPVDWFSNKTCATQYRIMFEEIEAEAPKRRREKKEDKKDRGTDQVATEIIIKKLKDEHLNELERRVKEKIKKYCEDKKIYDKIKSGNYDEKFLAEVRNRVRNERKLQKLKEQAAQPQTPIKLAPTAAVPTTPIAPVAQIVDKIDAQPSNDKSTVSNKDEVAPSQTVTVPVNVTAEKITSPPLLKLNSPPVAALPKLTSPRGTHGASEEIKVVDEHSNVPPVQEVKDEPMDKDEYDTASDETVKMDVDEGKATTTVTPPEEVAISENSKKQEESPASDTLVVHQNKDSVAIEHENSNDTIEEAAVDSVPEITTLKTENLSEISKAESKVQFDSVKQEAPISLKDFTEKTAASVVSKAEEAAPKGDKRKEVPEEEPKQLKTVDVPAGKAVTKVEEESSTSISIDASTMQSNKEIETATTSGEQTPAKRKRRSKAKTPNSTIIQTRSTRSQSHIKVEDSKDTLLLSASKASVGEKAQMNKGIATPASASHHASKRLSHSIDDSLDNTCSEESNDAGGVAPGKSSENESSTTSGPVPVEIDHHWRKTALKYLTTIQANKHANLFANDKSEAWQQVMSFVMRKVDLNSVKKRINDGQIRNWTDLKNEVMIMFANVYLCYPRTNRVHRAAEAMEEMALRHIPDEKDEKQKARRPGRPPTKPVNATTTTPEVQVKVDRRKTRGSISVEKPGAGGSSKKRNL